MTNFVAQYPLQAGRTSDLNGLSAVDGLIVDGAYLDGSWELYVHVEDLDDSVCVRVRGDISIGRLMHQVAEAVTEKQSWSEHALWWPEKNSWLLHTKNSLDQYGVQSDAKLVFRHTHGNLQIVLPSLATLVLRVNFSIRVFAVVEGICKELCIRHHEELSLMFPIKRENLKHDQPLPVIRHGVKKTGLRASTGASRSDMPMGQLTPSLNRFNDPNQYLTLPFGSATLISGQSDISLDGEQFDVSMFADCTQRKSAKTVFAEEWIQKPKNVQQKARMDGSWLDSSCSLMQHGIEPPIVLFNESSSNPKTNPPTLYLRFKYHSFYDLNANYDAVRIHQLYEQARWSLLAGHIECTEDEMVVFAAYQLQAELQTEAAWKSASAMCKSSGCETLAGVGCPRDVNDLSTRSTGGSLLRMANLGGVGTGMTRSRSPVFSSNGCLSIPDESLLYEEDEIDLMLTEIERSCNVSRLPKPSHSTADICDVVISQDLIKVFREKGQLIRRYKELWTVAKGDGLAFYRDPKSTDKHPMASYTLRDCLITPNVNPDNFYFVVKLSLAVSSSNPSTPIVGRRNKTREDVWLRFNSAEQYANWMAIFRIAARGKGLNNQSALDKEAEVVRKMLAKQTVHEDTPVLSPEELTTRLADLTDFCPDRIIQKARSKNSLRQRISETHAGMRDLQLFDAKLRYIHDWQRLGHFGRSYCMVHFDKESDFGLGGSSGSVLFRSDPQKDVLAIRQGRVEVVAPATEDTLLTLNFSDLRSWNANWDKGCVILEFRNGMVTFKPLTANCKTIVELIGGYVFMSQRNPDRNQKIDERLFHKLTGAND